MNTSERGGAAALESYLSWLGAELDGLPAAERREILLETRSHVLERTQASDWESVGDVLAGFGSPKEYAQRFLSEKAAAPRRFSALRHIRRLITAGWRSFPLLVLILAAYAVALFALVVAVWKILSPEDVGLWISYRDGQYEAAFLIFRSWFEGNEGREVLGRSLVVIGLSISVSIHLTISGLLRRLSPSDWRGSEESDASA